MTVHALLLGLSLIVVCCKKPALCFLHDEAAVQYSRIERPLHGTCGMQVHKCSVFASAAAIGVCGSLLQQTGFATAGVELTRRLRLLLLSTIMRQV